MLTGSPFTLVVQGVRPTTQPGAPRIAMGFQVTQISPFPGIRFTTVPLSSVKGMVSTLKVESLIFTSSATTFTTCSIAPTRESDALWLKVREVQMATRITLLKRTTATMGTGMVMLPSHSQILGAHQKDGRSKTI